MKQCTISENAVTSTTTITIYGKEWFLNKGNNSIDYAPRIFWVIVFSKEYVNDRATSVKRSRSMEPHEMFIISLVKKTIRKFMKTHFPPILMHPEVVCFR